MHSYHSEVAEWQILTAPTKKIPQNTRRVIFLPKCAIRVSESKTQLETPICLPEIGALVIAPKKAPA
jgi:hypothetical protein